MDVARLIVAWKKHLGNFSLEVEWTSDKADSLVRLLRPLIDAQHLSIPTTVRVLTGVFAASVRSECVPQRVGGIGPRQSGGPHTQGAPG